MLASLGHGTSASAVAGLYRNFVDVFVLDDQDAALKSEVERQGMRTIATPTVMSSAETKQALAKAVLNAVER
jgi:hypothetical protein